MVTRSTGSDLVVDWCSHEAAKYAVEHWHYSRCLPNQKLAKFGVWERGRFVGCVVFGDGANAGMLQPYGLDYIQGCELVRIALDGHKSPVSQVVVRTLPLLRQRSPGLRLIVSYADPEQGHHGGIYQAMNWLYIGMTEPADEYMVRGQRMHGRALRSTRSTHGQRSVPAANILEWAQKVLDPNTHRVEGSAKLRYLLPLDRAMRRQIQPLALPYPRGRSVEGDTPTVLAGEEGSIPSDRST